MWVRRYTPYVIGSSLLGSPGRVLHPSWNSAFDASMYGMDPLSNAFDEFTVELPLVELSDPLIEG